MLRGTGEPTHIHAPNSKSADCPGSSSPVRLNQTRVCRGAPTAACVPSGGCKRAITTTAERRGPELLTCGPSERRKGMREGLRELQGNEHCRLLAAESNHPRQDARRERARTPNPTLATTGRIFSASSPTPFD